MARILRPQEQTVRVTGGLNTDTFERAASSGAAIGNVQKQVGQSIVNMNNEFLNQATQAIQAASYSQAYSNANLEFAKRSQERYSQQVDDNGNPTFATLPQDIGQIGKEIEDEIAKGIVDPAVAARFRTNFQNFTSNQQVLSLSRARQQSIDYTRGSISQSLDKLATQAVLDDPSNLDSYKSQVQGILGEATQGGALSPAERQEMQRTFNETVTSEFVRSQIDVDPTTTLEALKNPDNFQDLDLNQRQRLISEAEAGQRDQQRRQDQQQKEANRVANEQQKLAEENLKLGIETGELGEADLLAAANSNQITEIQKVKLQRFLNNHQSKAATGKEISRQISDKIAKGESVFNYTTKQIDNHYNEALSLFADSNGQPPSLADKAAIAQKYNAPIESFTKELQYNLAFGSLDQATDALRAYEVVDEKSPVTVDRLDKRSKAIAATAQLWRQNTVISDKDALERARQAVLETDDTVRLERVTEFKNIDDFKDKNIRETTQEIFDTAFSFEPSLSPGMTSITKNLFREAYVLTGDEGAAKKMVQHELKKIFGETEFNGGNVVMAFSPEKVTGLPSDVLQKDLMDSVSSLVPEGTDIDDLVIQGSQFSRTKSGFRYPVFTKGRFGELEPVTNEDGVPMWWSPDVESIKQRQQADQRAKELQTGQDKRQLQNIKQNILNPAKSLLQRVAPAKAIARIDEVKMSQVLDAYGINTPKRMEHFFSQMAHESGGYTRLVEDPSRHSGPNFERYEPGTRAGEILGNIRKGDGARYRGRGYMQLTGRFNYRQIGNMIGVDLENNPELAADPQIAMEIAAAFWKSRNLNDLADRDDVNRITRKINGKGMHGLADRKARLRKIRGQ